MSTARLTRAEAFELVTANPHADAPRLAYADVCDAEGDRERARFIRLQIEAAERVRARRQDDWKPATDAYDMLRSREKLWAGTIFERVRKVSFRRGFVEFITIDARQFVHEAEELIRLAPIRQVELIDAAPLMEEIAASPHLRRLVHLGFENSAGVGDREAAILAASPNLGRLCSLNLRDAAITGVGVEALAASTNLPSLRVVNLHGKPAADYAEDVANDQGVNLFAEPSPKALALEAKYGRKAWFHAVADNGLREVSDDLF